MPAAARPDLDHHGWSITHNLQVDRVLAEDFLYFIEESLVVLIFLG